MNKKITHSIALDFSNHTDRTANKSSKKESNKNKINWQNLKKRIIPLVQAKSVNKKAELSSSQKVDSSMT